MDEAMMGETPEAEALHLEITVENLAPDGGTFLTPVWFGLHDGTFDLYDRGEPNFREGLERIAEDGTIDTIAREFMDEQPGGEAGAIVGPEGIAPGPIDPGERASVEVKVDDTELQRFLSFATMVIPSNDAFLSSPGDPLALELFDEDGEFRGPVDLVFTGSDVLDAGTEANTETDAAFLNQDMPDTGVVEDGVVELHPGFNGSIGNPDAEPVNILGGTTVTGAVIDPFAGDFTRFGGLSPLLRVEIDVVEKDGALPSLIEDVAIDPENIVQPVPGELPVGEGGLVEGYFLADNGNFDSTVGYYLFDLETGAIDEGFVLFASTDEASMSRFSFEVPDGFGYAPFLIPDGNDLGVDFTAFEDGGITFENPLTGEVATIDDEVAPTVLADGAPTELAPFHGLDGTPDDANPLNPDDLVHATSIETEIGTVVAFEDLFGLGDADFNDAAILFNDAPIGMEDVASLVDQLFDSNATAVG